MQIAPRIPSSTCGKQYEMIDKEIKSECLTFMNYKYDKLSA